ncbi:MAG: DNA ligase [Desulfobacterales bacterium]|nr:DNA ligase [Desulfobacterales bacterium]
MRTMILLFVLIPTVVLAQMQGTPMGAGQWTGDTEVTGWWMSEKLDGVRGCWTGRSMESKSGKPLPVPPEFTRGFPPFPLDGELWMGRGTFSTMVGLARQKKGGNGWKGVGYHIFDAPDPALAFEDRLDKARRWFQTHPLPHVHLIPQEKCRGRAHLEARLRAVEAQGGEGLMLRRPGSPYRAGRSRDILKVKTFQDAEARVVGHRPGKGRHRGRMGALEVELPNGTRFALGTGFTDTQRENPPPVGSWVTFKYTGLTPSGIPRFASFLRVRPPL